MQPIYKQFIEPDCEFPFNRLNRNLCFGGSGGAALKTITGGAYSQPLIEQAERVDAGQTKTFLSEKAAPAVGDVLKYTRGNLYKPELVKEAVDFVADPYSQSSYRPGEGTLGKALGNVSMESMLGTGGGDSGGGDYGASDTSTDTAAEDMTALEDTSAMTDEEKQNRIRQLMASRYGRRQTILTGGTGIQGFGEV